MDAGSGDGVRWSKGGSRAATGGSDAATAARRPGRGAGSGDPATDRSGKNDAAEIQALLRSLSQVRLAVSADLSAAAGALEDGRADIAADVIAGARGELAQLRAGVRRREHAPSPFPQKVPAMAGGAPAESAAIPEVRLPDQQVRRPRHRLASALAGAAALAIAIAVVPQVTRGSGHPQPGAAGTTTVQQSPDIRLASSEFTVLSQRLLAADASPATIVAAERSWQGAVAGSLPDASTNVAAASSVVSMLRQERTLLLASPSLRTPANQALATSLTASSQSLLSRLRQLADPQVLAILPTVLNAVPIPNVTTAPSAGVTPTPETSTAPSGPTTGAGSLPPPTSPGIGGTNPTTAPSAPASNPPSPDPGNVLPMPLPSLGQLTGGNSGDGDLGQTVGNLLNGLGLGG